MCALQQKTRRRPAPKTKALEIKMMKPRHLERLSIWLCAAALALAAPAVSAQQAAPDEEPETRIWADTLSYDDVTRESTYPGSVIMTRGLMTLHADTLVMREDADGFQHGVATVSSPDKRVNVREE